MQPSVGPMQSGLRWVTTGEDSLTLKALDQAAGVTDQIRVIIRTERSDPTPSALGSFAECLTLRRSDCHRTNAGLSDLSPVGDVDKMRDDSSHEPANADGVVGARFVPNRSADVGTGAEPTQRRGLAKRCELGQLSLRR